MSDAKLNWSQAMTENAFDATLERFAAETGWNDERKIRLFARFLQEIAVTRPGLLEAWKTFLLAQQIAELVP